MARFARAQRGLRTAAGGLLCGSVLLASPAFAQSEAATARGLFSEARKLMAAKKYAQACPKFEESERLDPGIGAMYNLADCWEHSGRTASAWAMFLDTAAAARAAGQSDRERVAKERAAALESKVSHLTVQIPNAEPNLEVKRDGEPLRAASFGVAVPVDPGSHHLEVGAPNKKPYVTDVSIAAGASVTVDIPALEGAAAATTPPSPSAETTAVATATPPPDAGSSAHPRRVVPYALLGVGVAGLAIGTVFEVKSRSANSDALGVCKDGEPCTASDIQHHDSLVSDAKSDRTIAFVGLGVGALALASGVILLVTGHPPTEQPSTSAWAVHFTASAHGGAAIAEGRF